MAQLLICVPVFFALWFVDEMVAVLPLSKVVHTKALRKPRNDFNVSNRIIKHVCVCVFVNDDYRNLHALLATLPDPSVDTGPVAIYNVNINIFLFHSRESQQRPDRREQGLCLAFAWNDASHFKVCNSFPD